MHIFDSVAKTKREFIPLNPERVTLYVCGPTVYDYAHIGNFRTYMFEDLLRRFLKYKGYRITQVMNLTDIDVIELAAQNVYPPTREVPTGGTGHQGADQRDSLAAHEW